MRCHRSALKHLKSLLPGLIEDEWMCNKETERLLEGGVVLAAMEQIGTANSSGSADPTGQASLENIAAIGLIVESILSSVLNRFHIRRWVSLI